MNVPFNLLNMPFYLVFSGIFKTCDSVLVDGSANTWFSQKRTHIHTHTNVGGMQLLILTSTKVK